MKIRLQIALAALVACPSNPTIKGELIGSFTFSAVPVSSDCSLTAVPSVDAGGSFTFDGILSRDTADAGVAYLIIGSVERPATFDGQVFSSAASASRHFVECVCDPVYVNEILQVALLSSSQDDALGHSCPPNPLDGGVPLGDPDGGISPPCSMGNGCDAVRACGELVNQVVIADAGCQPCGCTYAFQVEGLKKATQP
jgi:hypothetical protein